MPKKKLTLQQQYERQLKRIEKRIAQLQAEGYNVTSEIDLTKTPKRARREQVEKLRKITPAKLRKSAENGNITVTTRKKKKRKGPAKPKLQTAPKQQKQAQLKQTKQPKPKKQTAPAWVTSADDDDETQEPSNDTADRGKIIMQNIRDILAMPYQNDYHMRPDTYYNKIAQVEGLLDDAIKSEGETVIMERLANASGEIIQAVEGYIYGSDGSAGEQVSYSWLLAILYGDNIPDYAAEQAAELENYDETDPPSLPENTENIKYESTLNAYIDSDTGEILYESLGDGKYRDTRTGDIVTEHDILKGE